MTPEDFERRALAAIDDVAFYNAFEPAGRTDQSLQRLHDRLVSAYAAAFPSVALEDIVGGVGAIIAEARSRTAEIEARGSSAFYSPPDVSGSGHQ
jgi:hypothetical protein